jgi:hypothetical protein
MFLCVTMQPTIDLWIFANRYHLPYFKDQCTRAIPVQMSFMERYNTEGDLGYFLNLKVSDEAIDNMLAAIGDTMTEMMKDRDGDDPDILSHLNTENKCS